MFSAAALSSVAGRRWDEKHDRDGHFLCEPKDAACDPRLGKVDRQILTLLCRYANSAGRCSPSVAKLAREGGKDRSQVQRAIARLVAFGYVLRAERRKTRDRNQTNIYCVIYNSSLRRALILEARQAAEARRVQQKPARRAAALLGLARKRLHSAWESSPPPREKEPVAGDPKRGWAAVSAAENKTRVLINDSQSAVAATSDSSTDHGCVDCEAAAGNTDQEEARRDEYAPSCEPGSSTAKLVGRSAAQLERQNPRGIRKRRDGVSSPTPLSAVAGFVWTGISDG
jgi:predicted transcriptional regulator